MLQCTLSALPLAALMRPNAHRRSRAPPLSMRSGRVQYEGDPYLALGLEAGATAAAIRSAFRTRARVLHPDVSDDPLSAAKFRELCAAVEAIQAGEAFAKLTRGPVVRRPPG